MVLSDNPGSCPLLVSANPAMSSPSPARAEPKLQELCLGWAASPAPRVPAKLSLCQACPELCRALLGTGLAPSGLLPRRSGWHQMVTAANH